MHLLDSYNFTVGLALERLYLLPSSRPLPPPPLLPPHPCIPPSLPASPALRVPFYIKIGALKTRRYTKSTPWPLLHPARHHLFSSCLTSLLPSSSFSSSSSSSFHFARSYHRRCSFFSSSRSTAANNPRLRSSGGMEAGEEEWRGIGAITAAGTRSLSRGWVPPRAREDRRTGYDVCFSPREVTMPFSSSPSLEITYYTPVY